MTVHVFTHRQACPAGWFTCISGHTTCVQTYFKCDCANDCDDASDEDETYAGCFTGWAAICKARGAAGMRFFTFKKNRNTRSHTSFFHNIYDLRMQFYL